MVLRYKKKNYKLKKKNVYPTRCEKKKERRA